MCDECEKIAENISSDEWIALTNELGELEDLQKLMSVRFTEIENISYPAAHLLMCGKKIN